MKSVIKKMPCVEKADACLLGGVFALEKLRMKKSVPTQRTIGSDLMNSVVHYIRQSVISIAVCCSLRAVDVQAYTPLDGETVVVTNGGYYTVSANSSATFTQASVTDSVSARINLGPKATITLMGVNISGYINSQAQMAFAAITCVGDATIILADGTRNTLEGSRYSDSVYPAIRVGPTNTTLTIKGETEGTGRLYATGGIKSGYFTAPGIGVGRGSKSFGDVIIAGGIITGGGRQGGSQYTGLAIGLTEEYSYVPQSTGGSVAILDSITSAQIEFWGVSDESITIGDHLNRKKTPGYLLNTFTPMTYSVVFDANGGDSDSLRTVAYGRPIGTLPEPTLEKHILGGWYTDRIGGTQISASTEVIEDVTYYAQWIPDLCNPVFTPESGTIFETSLSVAIGCLTDGATIHYTTDGTDPTIESPVYRRFRIYGKTTVKAIAEKDGMLSEIVTVEYALGRCVDPVVSLADGTEFAHSNQTVSIRWKNDGVLRYTLDGCDPTTESPIYEGAFTVNDSVIVKAKVFSDDFFGSAVVTSSLTRVWEHVATPTIEAEPSFSGSKAKVVISCATRGALIFYTLNGDEPDSSSSRYTGSLYVMDSCTVKAYAEMPDYLDSAITTQEITKV